jgi:23S rRNA (uracil1939-C5)-methyltransferase
MPVKRKIVENVRVELPAAEGKCVTRIDGMATFVEGAAPGDVVDLLIKRKKKQYQEAIALNIRERSADRVDAFCSHFGTCGGCKWQHIRYEKQLEYKQLQVRDNLERIAKIRDPEIRPIIPSPDNRYYRNKLEFTCSNGKWLTREEIDSGNEFDRRGLGFHIPGRFDKVVDIDHCFLQKEPSNTIRNLVREYGLSNDLSFYDIHNHSGFLRNLIIRTTRGDEVMVILQVGREDIPATEQLLNYLISQVPGLTSVYYVINTKKNETFFDLPMVHFHGKKNITETVGNLQFNIGPKSFFQTNPEQAINLYTQAKEMAQITGHQIVYDLYTGTGTIANFVADKAKFVLGIENITEAIADAKKNAVLNGIKNTEFISGAMEDVLNDELFGRYGPPDVVITDPPRTGMHPKVIAKLLEIRAKRIVYISCNPATQARDLAMLSDAYDIDIIQPFDMFPHTHHVENIVSLIIKE